MNTRKILYVHYGDNWIRGSERCLLDLIQHLDIEEFSPIVWTNNHALHQKVNHLGLPSLTSNFSLLLGWTLPKYSIVSWLKLVWQACQIIRKQNIQLVHVNSAAPCQWMWLATKLCGVPMLVHLHSNYPLRDRLTLGLHLAPHIVTVSHAISTQLLHDGYPKENLQVIYNGIPPKAHFKNHYLNVKQQLQLDSEAFIFVTVGSLIKRKGMDKLIEAMAWLIKSEPNSHLLIIGDGPERESLQQLTSKLAICHAIHFIGEQNNVEQWLAGGADVFISGAQQEAFGLVIGEATQASLPVIAPNVGGIPELVIDGHSALLYPVGNIAAMVYRMRDLIHSPERRERLTRNAQRRVGGKFSLRRYVSKMEKTYYSLLTS